MLAYVLLAVALIGAFNQADAEFKRVCYVSNWAQYRPGDASFKPRNINPVHCTHINYAFAVITTNCEITYYEWNDDGPGGLYEELNNIKKTNPSIRTLIAVGGWNFGMDLIAQCMATAAKRQQFINSVVPFCRSRNFDGLDLDFEYPANRGSPPEDIDNYLYLVQGLKAAFDNEGQASGQAPLLLTMAGGVGKDTVDTAYRLADLHPYFDHINLMTYDLNGAWDPITGCNSPLYSRADEAGTVKEYLNIDWAAKYYMQKGVPRDKMIIGLATYGRCFTLANAANNGLGAPTTGPCTAGAYTREAGFLAYYEICDYQNAGGATIYDDEHQSPYMVYGPGGTQWVGFDDPQSLFTKVQYILDNGFGGLMSWNLDLDDFTGTHCNMGPYPLMEAMTRAITGGTLPPTTVWTGPTTTKAPTTPGGGGGSGFCAGKGDGLYADPDTCTAYYHCGNGNGVSTPCIPGLYYNPKNSVCDWDYNLDADRKSECGLA